MLTVRGLAVLWHVTGFCLGIFVLGEAQMSYNQDVRLGGGGEAGKFVGEASPFPSGLNPELSRN